MVIAFHGLKSRTTPIGVDLGARGVRLAQGVLDARGYTLQSAVQCERAGGAADDPADAQLCQRLLESCLRKVRFRGRTAVSALTTPDLEYHPLELPAAAMNANAEQVVRWEVDRLRPNASTDFETRHWRLPTTSMPAPNTVAVAAAPEAVRKLVDACGHAGLVCSRVDAAAAALVRLGCLLKQRPANAVWAVLDLGERQTRLVMCVDNTPVLVRIAGTGGCSWTQRVADALQVSFKTAETHKRTHGITVSGRTSRTADDVELRSELSSMVLGALRLDLNDVAAEVKRSYEYVLSCHANRAAADLVLVGGGAGLGNLPEFLSSALGIPVARASDALSCQDCRVRVAPTVREPIDRYSLAIGLTISE